MLGHEIYFQISRLILLNVNENIVNATIIRSFDKSRCCIIKKFVYEKLASLANKNLMRQEISFQISRLANERELKYRERHDHSFFR